MKIDRVILCANNNEMYYPFWNIVSKVYKTKFGIDPVLIWIGNEQEKIDCELSEEYGEIIICDYKVEGKLAWECTWALFYFTKLFSDEVCLIMGIDQIPLGTYFLKNIIEDLSDDSYIMLTDDAYASTRFKTWENNGISPTAYHIAKGKLFNEIYKFEDTFENEIKKIQSLNLETMWFADTNSKTWGFDETYSSKILFENKNNFKIIGLKKNHEFNSRRVDCFRNVEVNYNLQALKSNFYIECHSCRPYSEHKMWIDNLVENIPFFIKN
jgi:hypothetical protein